MSNVVNKHWSAYDEWNEFQNDILYHNRFFPSQKVPNYFKENKSEYKIAKESNLFRAREIPENIYTQKISKNGDCIGSTEIAGKRYLVHVPNCTEKFNIYTPAELDAPPAEQASAGRANPNLIRYLYTAETFHTAIAEIKPNVGQYVSVGKITLLQDLYLYDLTGFDYFENTVMSCFSRIFSKPITQANATKYLATQYICELIKHEIGMDGIRFKSSVDDANGNNIVLFNCNDETHHTYDITEEKIYRVKSISITVDEII